MAVGSVSAQCGWYATSGSGTGDQKWLSGSWFAWTTLPFVVGVDDVVNLAVRQRVKPLGPEAVTSAEKPWPSVEREQQADVRAPWPFQERLEPHRSSERRADERVVDEATAFARAGDAFGQHHFCLQRREGACEELAWVHIHVADDDERDRDELHEERDRTRLVDVDATHADACSEVERDDRNGDPSKSDQAEDPVVALGELLGWTAAGCGDGRGAKTCLDPQCCASVSAGFRSCRS